MERTDNRPVIVIAATNRPDSLDPALRRAGRFDREISLGIPDEDARERILRVLSRKLKLSGDFDFRYLAKKTAGYVGADLQALTKEAAVVAINRIFQTLDGNLFHPLSIEPVLLMEEEESCLSRDSNETPLSIHEVVSVTTQTDVEILSAQPPLVIASSSGFLSVDNDRLTRRAQVSRHLRSLSLPLSAKQLEPLSISMGDFEEALTKVQPSSKREGFATIPNVTWKEVGALAKIREELLMLVVEPIRHPEKFKAVGITTPVGVLLCGPPGCGKTLLAKAVAHESHANFISVKGPELLNKVGYDMIIDDSPMHIILQNPITMHHQQARYALSPPLSGTHLLLYVSSM